MSERKIPKSFTKEDACQMQIEKKLASTLVGEIEAAGFKRVRLCGRLPTVDFKFGGYSAAYYRRKHLIKLRWNVWKNLNLCGKRMLMIHECCHAMGLNHSGVKQYSNSYDLMTILVYKEIYGEDEFYKETMKQLGEIIKEMKEPWVYRIEKVE